MSTTVSFENNDTNTISIYNNIKEYKHLMSQDDPNYCKNFIKNMSQETITSQAKEIIGELDENSHPVFCHEQYSFGDCDEYGPTEHFWTLYIITENFKDGIKYHKFYREVYEMQGDIDDEIKYESFPLTDKENKILDDNYNQYYELYNVVYNCSKYLNSQAEKIISSIKEKIIFISEGAEEGDITNYGPREYYWTLYVFTCNHDGTINHRKFYREVYYPDNEEKVEYEEILLSPSDFQKKFIL